MKNFVIVVAGGSGSRMKTAVPKQFQALAGKPILELTISAFIEALADVHIVLVVPKEHLEMAYSLVEGIRELNEITITTGGATRFESVQNGLRLVPGDCMVFVHDAVRCLVTPALITRCLTCAETYGNGIPAISAVDSVRLETEDGNRQVDRRKVKIIQTPQTFKSALLKAAYSQTYRDTFTDDASVVECMGEKIHLVEGESSNIKITLPVDMLIAEEILKAREKSARNG